MMKRPEQLSLPFPTFADQVLLSINRQNPEDSWARIQAEQVHILASIEEEEENYQEPEPFCGPPQIVYKAYDQAEGCSTYEPYRPYDYEVKFE